MKQFRRFDGTIIPNVESYVANWLRDKPYGVITIGTDSQKLKNNRKTKRIGFKYTTVICMSNMNKGTHIIYCTETVLGRKSLHEKLWQEVENTKEVADVLAKLMIELNAKHFQFKVHIDINPNSWEDSHVMYASSMGYLKGLGYDVEAKPEAWAASHVADHLCK